MDESEYVLLEETSEDTASGSNKQQTAGGSMLQALALARKRSNDCEHIIKKTHIHALLYSLHSD